MVAIVPLAPNQPPLVEAQKFKHTLMVPLQIPVAIVANIELNGYIALDDLVYFDHSDVEDFCSARIIKALNFGGANYSNTFIKRLQVLVWRASEMKRLDQTLVINVNVTWDKADEWYFKAKVEGTKLKKDFKTSSPEKFVYAEWRK